MSIGYFETLCRLCKHRDGIRCAAYPNIIPLEIRLMHVDHRQPYVGDNGITFEPKDDSPRTLERLEKVAVRKGRVPAGPNDLDRRMSKILKAMPFESDDQRRRFQQTVAKTNTFEDLPDWCRRFILETEAHLSAQCG